MVVNIYPDNIRRYSDFYVNKFKFLVFLPVIFFACINKAAAQPEYVDVTINDSIHTILSSYKVQLSQDFSQVNDINFNNEIKICYYEKTNYNIVFMFFDIPGSK